ncbi:alpha/beta hydrolase-fold protein [Neobacillus mesonae]|nr:alpha/beta hydrolase-fold protein [Neobacillus mesonae]
MHIYLPPSYREGDARFPVVYIQDGITIVRNCLNLLEHKFRVKELPELILVGIVPNNRNDEYTPWPAKSLSGKSADFGGSGADYVSYVADTLKPYMDRSYRTLITPEHTAMIGASLGGMISMYAAYQRPDIFGRIGAISASMWYEGFLSFIQESEVSSYEQRLYMSVGSLEGIHKESIQKNMVSGTHEAYRTLIDKGFPEDKLKFTVEEGGTHDALFFAKHFPEALNWLYV